jgi:transposase-like protein
MLRKGRLAANECWSPSIPDGLTVFNFPAAHWQRLRTSNLLERLSRELKRRTRVVRILPNRESCERLVTTILMEKSEKWEKGRIYLNFDSD